MPTGSVVLVVRAVGGWINFVGRITLQLTVAFRHQERSFRSDATVPADYALTTTTNM